MKKQDSQHFWDAYQSTERTYCCCSKHPLWCEFLHLARASFWTNVKGPFDPLHAHVYCIKLASLEAVMKESIPPSILSCRCLRCWSLNRIRSHIRSRLRRRRTWWRYARRCAEYFATHHPSTFHLAHRRSGNRWWRDARKDNVAILLALSRITRLKA